VKAGEAHVRVNLEFFEAYSKKKLHVCVAGINQYKAII